MTTELKHLVIRRVGIVDNGANRDAFIELFKRDSDMADKQTLENVQKDLETVTGEKTSLEEKVADLEAQLAELKKEPEPDPIEKADPKVKEALAAVEKRAVDAEARIQKMEDQRDRDKFVKKAAAFGHIATADDLAEDLRDISKALGDERYKEFEGRLKTANERIATSKLFTEVGSDGDASGEPADKLEALAKSYAAENKVTYEQAYVNVLNTDEGKDLYMQEREG